MKPEITKEETSLAELKPFEYEKAELTEFVADYKNYVVSDENFKEALKAREKLRDRRYTIDKTLKANKKVLNDTKKKQEDMAEELLDIILPTENTIDSGIKLIEGRKEAERLRKVKEEEDRLAKIEEEKRLAMEAEMKAERERLEAIRIEQEAKEKELKEKEALLLKKQEDDRKAAEAEILKKKMEAQAEIDRKNEEARIELKKQEDDIKARQKELALQEKEAIDKKRREQEEAENKLRIEREAILREKAELEEKVRQAEAERQAKIEEEAEAKRQEALRPDKDKLLSFATSLESIEYPELSGEPESKRILEQAQATILGLQIYIRENVEII